MAKQTVHQHSNTQGGDCNCTECAYNFTKNFFRDAALAIKNFLVPDNQWTQHGEAWLKVVTIPQNNNTPRPQERIIVAHARANGEGRCCETMRMTLSQLEYLTGVRL